MVEDLTVALPGLILMVPALLALRGNICGALASRLGTGLNLGLIPPRLRFTREIKVNLISSMVLSALVSVTIGVFSYIGGLFAGIETVGILHLVTLAFVAGFASGIISAFLTFMLAIISYKRGWDPDNTTAPLMATIGDFVTVACIALAILVVA
jgi:mgtE-like transporter